MLLNIKQFDIHLSNKEINTNVRTRASEEIMANQEFSFYLRSIQHRPSSLTQLSQRLPAYAVRRVIPLDFVSIKKFTNRNLDDLDPQKFPLQL